MKTSGGLEGQVDICVIARASTPVPDLDQIMLHQVDLFLSPFRPYYSRNCLTAKSECHTYLHEMPRIQSSTTICTRTLPSHRRTHFPLHLVRQLVLCFLLLCLLSLSLKQKTMREEIKLSKPWLMLRNGRVNLPQDHQRNTLHTTAHDSFCLFTSFAAI